MNYLNSKYTFLFLIALLSSSANALTISEVDLADQIKMDGKTLILNGAGVRSKFFIDLYVGTLYVSKKETTLNGVIANDAAAIRLNITSSLISSEKMVDAIDEGFADATNGHPELLKPEIKRFLAMFSEEIKEGDQFTFYASKVSGVSIYKNEKLQGSIKKDLFRQALLKIWLGKEPAQKSLKEEMLNLK